MTSSVWRLAHLVLALFSFVFLLIASGTGIILAADAVSEKTAAYKVPQFNEITLAQSLPELRKVYPEILELRIDHNQFATIEGFTEEGDDFQWIADPVSGKVLGKPLVKSPAIEWVTSLHRSLFLHETGRFIVGFVSFLLVLIAVSGTLLIIKRQQGVAHFFAKIKRDFLAQYFHVVAGRLLLIPILIVSLTGTYLFLLRFEVIAKPEAAAEASVTNSQETEIPLKDVPVFRQTKLRDVVKVEFPFADDAEGTFKIKLKDRELVVNQTTGAVISETRYPVTAVLETLSLDLHTGRTNAVWAVILAIASLNILFFIYSGFVITLKRKAVKIRNKYKPADAEIIILAGSENGSTLFFAHHIQRQLMAAGKKAYLATPNQFTEFPNAAHIILCTSTYGLGEAPSNAQQFKKRVQQHVQHQKITFSVVGFGSKSYAHYCAFAEEADQLLAQQPWATRLLNLHTVNDRSPEDFVAWVKAWVAATGNSLAVTPALYHQKTPKLAVLKVVGKTAVTAEDPVFRLTLKTRQSFQSGDLLAVYPAGDGRERLYSIAKINGTLQLVVKRYPGGLGSEFLYGLSEHGLVKAKIVSNKSFHFPKKAPSVLMIANGTGIAPFLGMIEENHAQTNIRLYTGFRYPNSSVKAYETFIAAQKNKVKEFHTAFSREANSQYVMDLIRRDADVFADSLQKGGVVMICGALAMQQDVEAVLEAVCREKLGKPLAYFKQRKQVVTDCY